MLSYIYNHPLKTLHGYGGSTLPRNTGVKTKRRLKMARRKVTKTPDQISEKWGRNLKNAIPDIVNGVQAVTESPMEAAAAKADKMLQNLTTAVQNGTWANRLRGVSLAEWKKKTAEKVQQRMSGGVDAGMPKRKEFDTWLVGTLNDVLPTIADMPDLTLEDSVNRVRTLMEHMSRNRFKKGA